MPAIPRFRAALAAALSLGLVATTLALTAAPADASTPKLRGPVIEGDWADPEVVYDPAAGKYYAFATNFNLFGSWINVPVRSSSNLADWSSFEGDALPQLPGWAQQGLTWAPGVKQINGSWRLYFTARHKASGRQCIGVASASQAKGPYAAASAPIVCQTDRGGSIDAAPFRDPATGKWFLHWKSDENAPNVSTDRKSRLWSMELSSNGLSVVGTARVMLTYNGGYEQPLIENPTMIYNAGKYWLAYSANWWESWDYHDHLAVCSGPAGPCSRVGNPADPWLSKKSGIAGPGGGVFFTDAHGRHFIAFHGWTKAVGYAKGGMRSMHLEPVTFDGASGAPRLRPDMSRTALDVSGRTTLSEQHQDVLRLYRAFFNRDPDPAGARYWIGLYDAGHTIETIAASFALQKEYANHYSGTTNRQFMDKVYRNVLGRAPDTEGLNYWTSILDQKRLTRPGIVTWVAVNAEFKSKYKYPTMP